jgi:hypothetical protein
MKPGRPNDVVSAGLQGEQCSAGFQGLLEEALKAVKQSRFEPAQKDGQNVAAEFTFIYRFRMQR